MLVYKVERSILNIYYICCKKKNEMKHGFKCLDSERISCFELLSLLCSCGQDNTKLFLAFIPDLKRIGFKEEEKVSLGQVKTVLK